MMNFVSNNFNRFNDAETQRQKKNATKSQQKNVEATKEGVIVNSYIKDSTFVDMDDIYTSMVIPKNAQLPKELSEDKQSNKKFSKDPLFPLCVATIGILAGTAGVTKILQTAAKKKTVLPDWQKLPDIPRNMNLNKESHFVTYVTVQNPNSKTILSALAFFAFSSCVFVLKNFVDGFKDVWVKKQDADIQKNLQEKLINVETTVFSGKMQIVRQMLSEKANIFNNTLNPVENNASNAPSFKKDTFKIFKEPVNFKGAEPKQQVQGKDKQKSNIKLLLAGAATLVGSVFLVKATMKNVRATSDEFKKYNDGFLNKIQNVIENTTKENKTLTAEEQNQIKDIFSMTNFKSSYAKEVLTKANIKEEDVNNIVSQLEAKEQKRFVNPPENLGGRLGIQYYTYIDDIQGHFYNWIMNKDMPMAKYLFFALSTVSGLGYLGKIAIEAVKDVQVKKANADTELGLQKNLIPVELKNFHAKKQASIDPLMEEFENKKNDNASNEELKTMADSILFEIKNGAPFVYS